MTEPLKLLRLIAEHTDRVFIWTHFYPDDFAPVAPLRPPLLGIRYVEFGGKLIPHFDRSYMGAMSDTSFCGGVQSGSSWLRRGDILSALTAVGFSKIEIAFENRSTDPGPSFALVALRAGA